MSGTVMPRKNDRENPFKIISAGGASAQGDGGEHLYEINDGLHSRSACWAIGKDPDEDLGGASTTNLLAYRQDNGKIVYLATTDPALAANKFVLTVSARPREHVVLTYGDDDDDDDDDQQGQAANRRRLDPTANLEAVNAYLASNGLLELTEGQGNSIWFLLRRFRITSYVIFNILR